eukprot:scaffold214640_cov44-Tisochrysis_lutea.AAC.2
MAVVCNAQRAARPTTSTRAAEKVLHRILHHVFTASFYESSPTPTKLSRSLAILSPPPASLVAGLTYAPPVKVAGGSAHAGSARAVRCRAHLALKTPLPSLSHPFEACPHE